ncbi:sigma-70 family RNA polymerase sigma factor [Candidatus Parcubacteria bacterium]|nr:sigma-70 family RNA polymerase sigma factor [Patescibacteria group bacterium]MBU4466638.1 sigma-70 family RNA polymerase sigma factor [Patescibacteria group bacterium]MCG2688388.1 sigma-70 family RNA polymerase sigma factor [Candidatus Parcubacteria bacterium]
MDFNQERQLVKEAKKNSEAFTRLYDYYYPRIFGYVLKRTGDVEISKDIVSETFIKALKNINQFQWRQTIGIGPNFGSWLYRIASNEISNFFRKQKPVTSLEFISDPRSESDLHNEIIEAQTKLARHEDFIFFQKQIVLLSLKYQEVLVLRFFEKKKVKEIAEILGKSQGTIKSLLHRGLIKLRKQMPPIKD